MINAEYAESAVEQNGSRRDALLLLMHSHSCTCSCTQMHAQIMSCGALTHTLPEMMLLVDEEDG
jgi:hypothetical protein